MHRLVLMLTLLFSVSALASPTPEWVKPKGVALVYPYQMDSSEYTFPHSKLVPFFQEYIRLILQHGELQELTLILKQDAGSPAMETTLRQLYAGVATNTKLKFLHVPKMDDIWLRDWGPIQPGSNSSVFVKG